jgi:hypothetical protein
MIYLSYMYLPHENYNQVEKDNNQLDKQKR